MFRFVFVLLTLLVFLSGTSLFADVATPAASSPAATGPAPARVTAAYFYSPTCIHCQKAGRFIDKAQQRFAGRLVVQRYDVTTTEGMAQADAIQKQYNLKIEGVPCVFVAGRALTGSGEIESELLPVVEAEIKRLSASTQPAADTRPAAARGPSEPLTERVSSFQVGAIVAAGLVDGFNPCAFTTAVFLISMLTYLGRSRRQIILVGAAFSVAVFATYLALGLGIFQAIKAFSVHHGLAMGITYAMAALAAVLGLWSLRDAVSYSRKHKTAHGSLGLPASVRARIHEVIRKGLKTRNLVMGALAVGFMISLLESVCTGQMYLPTITLMVQSEGLSAHGLAYLLLYNVMFILPLLAIVALSCWGVGSERIGAVLRKHLAATKYALAVMFLALGALLLVTAA